MSNDTCATCRFWNGIKAVPEESRRSSAPRASRTRARPPAMTAQQLVKARETLGLTQAELGDAMGITGRAIRNYEAGRSIPGPVVLSVHHLLLLRAR